MDEDRRTSRSVKPTGRARRAPAPARGQDLGLFVREQRAAAHLSLRRLSELSGISNPYLSQIERGLRRPSAEILQQLAGALDLSAEALYVRAGILEDRGEDSDVAGAVRRDPDLTESQKHTLLHVYETFRAETTRRRGGRGPEQGAAARREPGPPRDLG